jgi:hypothetical protein
MNQESDESCTRDREIEDEFDPSQLSIEHSSNI